jgi:hypothetical protein
MSAGNKPMRLNRKPRIGALDSVGGVRRELARIYKLWRYRELDDSQIRAGVCALRELREALVASDLESRITALEAGTKPK